MISRLRRWWARHRPRMRTLTAAEAADMLLRAVDGLATCGTLTIDDDLPTTETRRPTMDLDMAATIDHLVARWRRLAEYVRTHPGQLTPADVYEQCADALEARIRSYEIQRQRRGEGVAV